MGLVELGVGLIPAGGGTKEMLVRALERAGKDPENDLFPHLSQAFETIALGKVSGSAHEAKALGLLRSDDGVSMNRDRLIAECRQMRRRPNRPRERWTSSLSPTSEMSE